jgi:hypothetical protein
MEIAFKSYAELDLSFKVLIKATWRVGTYDPPILGAGSSAVPPEAYTP